MFESIEIRKVNNGFILVINTEDDVKEFVYDTERKLLRVIKQQLKGLLRTCEQCGVVCFLGAHPVCRTEANHVADLDRPNGSAH